MDVERLKQLKGLVGKEVKGIAVDVDKKSLLGTPFNENELDKDSEGFDLVFTDGTKLEVYDISFFGLKKHGLGWCIDKSHTAFYSAS